ncbi:TonB-dependent hemoglobin/transferrin/lactoferrin family receptor [Aliagarivorans taiwanensis]|uniref:TonB-dependent hemoglobin/transferrin/lactoferrin family receptor n=1 Tax=Aliagarivorans TaxID=882379 RepID=UPI000405DBC3
MKQNNLTPLSLAIAAVFCASAQAEQTAETFTFDEVVVSATRSEQALRDVASAVATINSDDIDSSLSQDLQQALKSEPGVAMEGQGRFGLSGFNIRGRDENYVKVIVDGVQQSGIYNPGADQMRKFQGNIEIDTLQSIEINKGPVSSLYGSDALGGAVLMRTKNPADLLDEGDDTHLGVKAGYASADDSYKTTLSFANRSGDWESLMIFTHRDGNEQQTHGSGADISGRDRGAADPFSIRSNNLLAKLFYQASDAHRFGVTAEYFERDSEGQILSNDGYEIMPGFVYTRNSAEDQDRRQRYSVEHQWQADLSAFDSMDWQLSYQQSHSKHNNFDHTPFYDYRNRQRNGEDQSWQFESQFDKAFALGSSYQELVYGLSYQNNRFELDYNNIYIDRGYSEDATPEVPNADSDTWGLYVQNQGFYMDERLVLSLGLRYDNFSSDPKGHNDYQKSSNDKLTGRAGVVYHWDDAISTFAQVSQGFKAPTLYDLYYAYDMGAVIESNPDLKPEESIAYEAGLRFNNHFSRLELVGFYNDYKNFIEQRYLGESEDGREIYRNENVASAEIYGVELSYDLAWDQLLGAPRGLYSSFNLAYAKGEDKEQGDALDSVAPLSAYAALGYDASDERYGGKLAVTMAASKEGSDWSDPDNIKAPGYAVVDLTAYYRVQPELVVRAGLFNAFDKKYWLYNNLEGKAANDQGLDRRTETGRNWGVELDYVF